MRNRRQPSALKMVSYGKLRRMQFTTRQYVIGPWLREGESVMLWAPAGLGKTMLSLTIALAVAGGGKVFGWTFDTPRQVLFLDGEMHIQDLRDRLEMLAPTIEGLDMEAAARNLVVMSRQHQDAETEFPDLANKKEGQDVVISQALEMKAELVICDNLSTLADVTDENDASAMNPVLSFLMRMKQVGIATILVHHSDKTGSNYRGSSKLATTFEAIIGLHRLDGRSAADGTGFELRWDKLRGKRSAATRDTEMTLVDPAEGHLMWVVEPSKNSEILVMLDAVRTGKFDSQTALCEHLGWPPYKVSRVKKAGIARQEITEREWNAFLSPDSGGPNTDF
jgi:KaiC/GvpD/RAD55 family RecA-like ATPase